MCYPIGARLVQRRILALDTLYQHLFSTPGCDATTIDHLKHDLVLWLTHHSFEELPDSLEYYLADPNSDLKGDLAHLTCLDPWGEQIHIHPLVTIYINTLLAWAKCFLATYGVYPGLYDLLDTPRRDFLAAQLHLRDSTLPRPLLHRSRGAPTIRSEYVAIQPHLAPPPHPIVCTSVAQAVRPSPRQSVVRPVRPSSRQPPQSVSHPASQSHCLSIPRTVRPSSHPSVIRTVRPPSRHSVHDSSVRHPPSVLRNLSQTVRPCPTVCTPSVLRKVRQTIRHRPTVCTPSYHVCQTVLHPTSTTPTSPSDHPQPSYRLYATPPVRQTIRHHHTICTTHQSVRQPVCHQLTV